MASFLEDRIAKILEMRKSGLDESEIAEALNITGDVIIYGNLTLSDVDLTLNTTSTGASDIITYSGGLFNITNQTNLSANNTDYKFDFLIGDFLSVVEIWKYLFQHKVLDKNVFEKIIHQFELIVYQVRFFYLL